MFLPGILDSHQKNLLPQDGVLEYLYPLYTDETTTQLFQSLLTSIRWQQDCISMYGKVLPLPRLTAWYGDPGIKYSYSKIQMESQSWTPELLAMKGFLEQKCAGTFNSVLLNLYRDQADHVSWHADDEPELGVNPLIASVSLGATRKFQLKHRTEKMLPKISLNVERGSLLVMKGEIQENWWHRIAPTQLPCGSRINLTFRKIKSQSQSQSQS